MDDVHETQIIEAHEALSKGEFEKALSLLSPLADKLIPGALSLLGVMYQLGEGVEMNGIKAVELLTKAVELGNGVASHNLGTIYAMGMPGVVQDFEKSKACYRRAKSMGAQFAPDSFYE
jgi:TPR repeat protein